MQSVWIAYIDVEHYDRSGRNLLTSRDAIKIKGIFDNEVECLRFVVDHTLNNYKCKEFKLGPVGK